MATGFFIAARAVHFGACLLLFGLFAFDRFVAGPILKCSGDAIVETWSRHLRRTAIVLPWLILISGIGWFILVAMNMSGLPFSDAISPGTLGLVWHQTAFGAVWRIRLIIWAGAIFISFLAPQGRARLLPSHPQSNQQSDLRSRVWSSLGLLIASLLLGSLAWAGHGRETSIGHLVADIAHLLVAGFWPTGLWPLFWFLRKLSPISSTDSKSVAVGLVRRFSAMSLIAVFLLVVTGWINSYFLLGSFGNLFSQTYGRWLLAKIIFVLLAVVIGAVNLLKLKPRLGSASSDCEINRTAQALKRNVFAEIVFGLAVVIVVAILGLLPPSVSY